MPDIEYPDLPDTWEWWSGNRGAAHYTRWFGTRHAENGYEGVISSDGLQTHSVQIFPFLLFEKMAIRCLWRFLKQTKRTVPEAAAVAAVPNSSEN